MASHKNIIVNLGTSHVSASIFSFHDESIKLIKYEERDLSLLSTDEEQWMSSVQENLLSICKENKIKGSAKFILPASKLLSKTIRVPKVEAAKQKQVVSYELGQKMPFPLSEMNWDFQIIDDDGIEQEILAYAVKPKFTEEICNIAYECGLLPTHLCPCAILDHEVLSNYPSLGDYQEKALLNIGSNTTTIIFSNPSGFLVRTINSGGFSLTNYISENFGISLEKAEELKINYTQNRLKLDESDPALGVLKNTSQNFFNKISQDISRSIVTYKRLKKGKSPEVILLTGNTFADNSLFDFIAESQQLPLIKFDANEFVELGEDLDDSDPSLNNKLSEPIGFAHLISKQQKGFNLINLLPDKIVKELRFKQKKLYLTLSFICVSLLPIPSIFQALKSSDEVIVKSNQLRDEIDLRENEVSQLKSKIYELNSYQNFNRKISLFIEQLDKLSKRLHSQVRLINNIQDLTQSEEVKNLWIDSIEYTQDSTNLNNLPPKGMHSQSGVSVNITGRYLVVPVNTATGNPDTLRNYLVQTNSIIQEKLTEGCLTYRKSYQCLKKYSLLKEGVIYLIDISHTLNYNSRLTYLND